MAENRAGDESPRMTLVPAASDEEALETDRLPGHDSLSSQPAGQPESEERHTHISAKDEESAPLPDRYVAQTTESGQAVLSCRETPNIMVQVERGLTVSAANARKMEQGSIFLDGAAQGPPFLDTEKHTYNFDHHEGCVRSFTLSSCEQAYIMVRKGLQLRKRDWRIHANEPDLDTILAIWIILNHSRLNDEAGEIRSKILPLVRLEGVIDVHGLEMQELACLAPTKQDEASAQIAQLMEQEIALKKGGEWAEISFSDYTVERLRQIDSMVYSPFHFDAFKIIDEIARVEITEAHIAVICHSQAGIYEVEQQLMEVHQDRLGIIVLQKDEAQYTLRQGNLFLPVNLQRVYSQLNLIDPGAKGDNRWGGSDDIGGSPRDGGTRLTVRQIGDALLRAFHKPTPMEVLSAAVMAAVVTLVGLLTSWVAIHFWDNRIAAFATALTVISVILLFFFARQYPRLYGLRLPLSRDWLLLLPGALLGGLLGGAWFPAGLLEGRGTTGLGWELLLWPLLLAGAAEILFRSLAHGVLTDELRSQRSGGRWFLSWPALGSAALYSAASMSGLVPRLDVFSHLWRQWWLPQGAAAISLELAGTLIFGICCAMARERSESIVAALLFHWFCILLLLSWFLV